MMPSGSIMGAEGISSFGSKRLRQLVRLHPWSGSQGDGAAHIRMHLLSLIKPQRADTSGVFRVSPNLIKLRLTVTSLTVTSLRSEHMTL